MINLSFCWNIAGEEVDDCKVSYRASDVEKENLSLLDKIFLS